MMPLVNVAMDTGNDNRSFIQKHWQKAVWGVPLAITGCYVLPPVLKSTYNYAKENTAQATKVVLLTAWNCLIGYDLYRSYQDRCIDIDKKDPSKRPSCLWLCRTPFLNATTLALASCSPIATGFGCTVAGISALAAHRVNAADRADISAEQKLGQLSRDVDNQVDYIESMAKFDDSKNMSKRSFPR